MKINVTKRQMAIMLGILALPFLWGGLDSRAQQVVAVATDEPQAVTKAPATDTPAGRPADPAPQPGGSQPVSPEPASATVRRDADSRGPSALIEVIRNAQAREVHQSCGTWAHEVFTDLELAQFKRERTAQAAAERARTSSAFTSAVAALRAMTPEKRDEFLESCRRPLRKTFAQRKAINCDGQSDAGQAAELLVADAIADLAAELAGAMANDAARK